MKLDGELLPPRLKGSSLTTSSTVEKSSRTTLVLMTLAEAFLMGEGLRILESGVVG